MPPPPEALLLDELVEEVLLRTPPDEPERLVRAALACKRWCRLVSGAGFRRRFCQRHRTAPLLGILRNSRGADGCATARFVPACSFRPPRTDLRGWRALHSQHGRVLLRDASVAVLAVWNPIMDELRELPALPQLPRLGIFNGAVLCGAAAGDCDHLDCGSGPFLVVFLGNNSPEEMLAYVYSSEAGAWSEPTTAPNPGSLSFGFHSAHVGNALYFALQTKRRILKYDLDTREMTVIDPLILNVKILHMTAEGAELLCIMRTDSNLLSVWSRKASPNGDLVWVRSRVIELDRLFLGRNLVSLYVIGLMDGGGVVVYVSTDDGCFY